MKAPADMTAGEINKALDKLDKARHALTNAMIAAGRGYEKYNETLEIAARDPSDEMAQLFASYDRQWDALKREISLRMGPGAPSRLPPGRMFGPRKYR